MFASRIRLWASVIAAASLAGPVMAQPGAQSGTPENVTRLAQAGETGTPAETDAVEGAVAFAREMTRDATAALTAEGASEAEKLAAFQQVLADGLALDVIGRFMLGDNRKAMSQAQIERYETIFPDYITRLYADQFADIVGRPLEVLDARAIGARDVIVRTQFPRSEGSPIMVDWRVRHLRDGDRKMIDIIVSGVSIMLVKREEFSSFIAARGVDDLLDRLETEAAG